MQEAPAETVEYVSDEVEHSPDTILMPSLTFDRNFQLDVGNLIRMRCRTSDRGNIYDEHGQDRQRDVLNADSDFEPFGHFMVSPHDIVSPNYSFHGSAFLNLAPELHLQVFGSLEALDLLRLAQVSLRSRNI